jgi:hypothetical protein
LQHILQLFANVNVTSGSVIWMLTTCQLATWRLHVKSIRLTAIGLMRVKKRAVQGGQRSFVNAKATWRNLIGLTLKK